MGTLGRMMALRDNPIRTEVPMLQIVPDQAAAAKPNLSPELRAAFPAELDGRSDGGDFARREELALQLGNELLRAELTDSLARVVEAQGDGDMHIDGELYRVHAWGTVVYHSLVGKLQVRRPTVRKVGVRNGATKVPLELAAQLVERATPALAVRVAMGKADGSSGDLHRHLMASHRIPPGRATLEVMGNAIGSALQVARSSSSRRRVVPLGRLRNALLTLRRRDYSADILPVPQLAA